MRTKTTNSLSILAIVGSLSAPATNAYTTYVTKKGDTISDILFANDLGPIYGGHGLLKKTLKLNPNVAYSSGDKIYPGTKLILPDNISGQKKLAEAPFIEKIIKPVPVVPLAPVVMPEEKREVSNIFNQTFFWQVSPAVSWKELNATDSNVSQNSQARVLSDMSYGADVVYGMRFSPDLDIYSRLFIESVNFSSDNSIAILKKRVTTSFLGVGAFYKKKWQFEAGMGDELFLTSPNATSIDIKKVSLPRFKTTYKNEFYQFQEATLSYALSGKLLAPRAGNGVDPKFSYGAGAGIEARLRNQSFLLGYEETFLKASENSTNSKNIFWRYTWETP